MTKRRTLRNIAAARERWIRTFCDYVGAFMVGVAIGIVIILTFGLD